MVSSSNNDPLQERCQSDSALNHNFEITNELDCIRQENQKLISQLAVVSKQLDFTENSLNEAEHDLANTKRELFETMKKLVDAMNEVSNYESHINDVNIQNGQLKQELDKVKIDKSRLEEEMKMLKLKINI